MLRFFAGILLVQAVTAVLVLVVGVDTRDWDAWWPIILALVVIGLVVAFWFSTIASHLRRDELDRARAEFAREREGLRAKAERDKTRLIRDSQKTIASEARRAEAKASLKVGVAAAAATGFGLLMMLTNFMTLGLLLLTGAGSGLGGYLAGRKWLPRRLTKAPTKPVAANRALPERTSERVPE